MSPSAPSATHRHFFAPVLLLVSLAVIVGGIYGTFQMVLPLQGNVTQPLILMMSISSMVFVIVSYVIFRSGTLHYLGSLRLLMLLIVGSIVAIVLFYLWLLSVVLFANSIFLPFMTMAMFFTGISALALGYFTSRALTDRLFDLAKAADQVAQGHFDTRLDIIGNDEIAQLSQRFNAMSRDLQTVEAQKQQLEQSRRDLVAWISHDLRTPLASMRVMMEALDDGIISDQETQTRYIKTTLNEIQHLSHMITDLFDMAKLDVGHIELDLHPTPIADLISDTIGSLQAQATKKGLQLIGTVDDQIDVVYIAPDKIQRVLKNLVDNAIKYTPPDETVHIQAKPRNDGMLQVSVHNSGVHIPAAILPNLFESFYRGEQSRSTTSDDERGTGLGLAIARGFVQAHGGQIWVESNATLGTVFTFTIPIKKRL